MRTLLIALTTVALADGTARRRETRFATLGKSATAHHQQQQQEQQEQEHEAQPQKRRSRKSRTVQTDPRLQQEAMKALSFSGWGMARRRKTLRKTGWAPMVQT